jgi:hypothetical protein
MALLPDKLASNRDRPLPHFVRRRRRRPNPCSDTTAPHPRLSCSITRRRLRAAVSTRSRRCPAPPSSPPPSSTTTCLDTTDPTNTSRLPALCSTSRRLHDLSPLPVRSCRAMPSNPVTASAANRHLPFSVDRLLLTERQLKCIAL